MDTPEQQARDLLERMDVPDAQNLSAGDLTELANLIVAANARRCECGAVITAHTIHTIYCSQCGVQLREKLDVSEDGAVQPVYIGGRLLNPEH